MVGDWRHFSGPCGVPMPWDCNAPLAASDVHTSLPREAIRSTGVPMAGRVTLQEPDAGRQAPYSMGMTYGRDHSEVRAPSAQISPGMPGSNLGIGMSSTPDHRECTPVELGRNGNLLAESVTAPTDVTYNLGTRELVASELVSRNFQTGAMVPVIPDTTLPLSVSTTSPGVHVTCQCQCTSSFHANRARHHCRCPGIGGVSGQQSPIWSGCDPDEWCDDPG